MAKAASTGNQGFASMNEDKQREIASKGGKAQGKENNPANLANRSEQDRKAISKKGGESSHGGGNS